MKTFLALGLALLSLAPAQAEIFRSPVGRGHGGDRDRHDHGGRFDRSDWNSRYVVRRPSVYVNYGYGYGYPSVYDYGYYGSYGYGGYAAGYPVYSGTGTSTGLLLGALAGGIIGNNSRAFHHDGLLGAIWGAGVGSVIGTVADANRAAVVYEQPAVVAPAPVAQVQTQTVSAAPAAVTPSSYAPAATPMSSANALFGRN